MRTRSTVERFGRIGLLAVLAVLCAVSFDRARRGRYDFHHFYLDARYVWEHGALNPHVAQPPTDADRQLPFYLPVVPLALSPLAAAGRLPAAVLWVVAQLGCLLYSLHVLRRWCVVPADSSFRTQAIAVVLALPALFEAARFNQVSFFVLALLLAAVSALERNRNMLAGAWLAAAVVLKLLPALFFPWLLLKRRWTAALSLAVVSGLLIAVPPTLRFGVERSTAYHREWFDYNVRGDAGGAMLNPALPEHFIDRRNQSITQVLARLAWPEHPYAAPLQPLHLSRETCQTAGRVITLVLLAGLLLATRRRWAVLTAEERRAEAALFAIAMLVLSPLLRQYYLVWALPAVVLLATFAVRGGPPGRRLAARAGLVIWLAGMAAWIWPAARLMGAHLVMLILVGALLWYAGAVKPRAPDAGAGDAGCGTRSGT